MPADRTLPVAVLSDPGFVPGRRDLPGLFARLGGGDRETAALVERALLRVDTPLATEIVRRIEGADPTQRARLVRLAARRIGREDREPLREILEEALFADAAPVRRAAARGLGRTSQEAEAPLLRALAAEVDASARRAMIEALGKIGGAEAIAALDRDASAPAKERETERVRALALTRARRSSTRAPARWSEDARWPAPVRCLLRCRPGLAPIVADEVRERLTGVEPWIVDEGVEIGWQGPASALFAVRTWSSIAFRLPRRAIGAGADPLVAAAEVLTSDATLALVRALTPDAPVRYRIEWAPAGKRRSATRELAAEVARRTPDLSNDPSDAPWVATIDAADGEVGVELAPALPDPRFTYRRRDVPAASHPTIAAAIARLALPRGSDVVWDPFVGSGLELCECHLLARPRVLLGTDLDPRALDAARANLGAAGADQASLRRGDALTIALPHRPTLIVTNPPMGRRVGKSDEVAGLLVAFVARAAELLGPGGRMVWMTPHPRHTDPAARRAGLTLRTSTRVDLGGVTAWLQLLSARRAHPGSRERTASGDDERDRLER